MANNLRKLTYLLALVYLAFLITCIHGETCFASSAYSTCTSKITMQPFDGIVRYEITQAPSSDDDSPAQCEKIISGKRNKTIQHNSSLPPPPEPSRQIAFRLAEGSGTQWKDTANTTHVDRYESPVSTMSKPVSSSLPLRLDKTPITTDQTNTEILPDDVASQFCWDGIRKTNGKLPFKDLKLTNAIFIKSTTTGNCSEVTKHDFKKKCASWLIHAPDRIKNVKPKAKNKDSIA
ncbi:hypothetical protein Fcan01_28163 [Folsomia candida]|uniref:Uncharacterized protein n=1 Tax=Folsomia candida TaxID=158441 RepID=A0A226CWG4_FOLCA|nr:hypothetical protein Fcan01_28163 [Folsomia candida]